MSGLATPQRRRKRPAGAGHIHRNKNGLWVFQINVGRHAVDGWWVQRAIYARSLADLMRKVNAERVSGWGYMLTCRRTPRPARKPSGNANP